MNNILNTIKQKYSSSIILQRFTKVFSVDVLVRGANFLLIFIFIRLMTKDAFGIYGYLYSFAMALSGILNFGFYTAISKLYVDDIDKKERQQTMLFTITTSLVVLVFISLFVVCITNVDAKFFGILNKGNNISIDTYKTYRVYEVVAVLSMIFTSYLTFYFVASEQITNIQRFNLLRLFLSNGTAIALLYFCKGIDGAMLRLSATYVCELVLTIIFFRVMIKNMRINFDSYYLKKAFIIGSPIMVNAIVCAMMNFGDKFFVMKYCGKERFAEYNLATQIATIISIIFQSFNFVWLPLFFKEKDLNKLKSKTKKIALRILFIFIGMSFLIWVGSFVLFKIKLFTPTYYPMLKVLPLLLLSQTFMVLVQLYTNYMMYFEKTYVQFLVGTVVSVLCYYAFSFATPLYGTIGVGVVLLLQGILQFIFYILFVDYCIKRRLRKTLK